MFEEQRVALGAGLMVALFAACASAPKETLASSVRTLPVAEPLAATPAKKKSFALTTEDFWRIELPASGRFDASGLAWNEGRLLIVADQEPAVYQIEFAATNVAQLRRTTIFSWDQLQPFVAQKRGRFDFEGLARDERGRIYASEEANRWVFRWDPSSKQVERLEIDWSAVKEYFSSDDNASFEGIAVGAGKLWLANERERARVIEVDLESLKIAGDFAPQPSSWRLVLHYSDVCYFKGRLFLLARHHYVILEIDPSAREVVAEYDYRAVENAVEHQYLKAYPTGTMEGLAVDDDYFWLVTDNNGFGRQKNRADRRPTLFKCRRPGL